MSGDVVMPHSQTFGEAINQAAWDTNDNTYKTEFIGAGMFLGGALGRGVAWGIGAVTYNPALGAALAVPASLVGTAIGYQVSSMTYEVLHSDWYRGVVQHEQDNNTNDNIMQYNGMHIEGNSNVFDYGVKVPGSVLKVDAFFDRSGAHGCQRIDVTGTDAAETFGACDVRNVIKAGNGNDKVYAGGGADIVDGGGGNDFIQDGQGADKLTGGKGADHFDFVGDASADTVTDFYLGEDVTERFGHVVSVTQIIDQYGTTSLFMVSNGEDKLYIKEPPYHYGAWSVAEVQAHQDGWGIH